MWHALEQPSDAGRAAHPEEPERDRRFADTGAGRAGRVVRELEPFSGRTGDVEACCRVFGLRLKRSGTLWPERGANAMLALECRVLNHRLADLPGWRANQAAAA